MKVLQNNDSDGHELAFDNQTFLLNFIMGTYLGPDITFDNPRSSAFQRIAENAPPYTSRDLGSSFVSISLLEKLYYYLLRKAEPSLILNPEMLHKYLKGSLHLPGVTASGDVQQFTRLFPLHLHGQIWYPASFRVVKGIVLIDDPVASQREEKDLEKFRTLSHLGCLKIDMDDFVRYNYRDSNVRCEQNLSNNGKETTITGHESSEGNAHPSARSQQNIKRKREDCNSMPLFSEVPMKKHYEGKGDLPRMQTSDGPAFMSLYSILDAPKLTSKADVSIVLSGTARNGKPGPPVGVVDIGVSKVAYYFRVSLPGVRKDYCKFSCEIESSGIAHVRGSTTGGKTIRKPSRVFKMMFRQLCPPGPFSLSFSLPGPVDPRLFAPNFRSDGVFEGVIIKHSQK